MALFSATNAFLKLLSFFRRNSTIQESQATFSVSPFSLNGSTEFGGDDMLGAMQKLVGQVRVCVQFAGVLG